MIKKLFTILLLFISVTGFSQLLNLNNNYLKVYSNDSITYAGDISIGGRLNYVPIHGFAYKDSTTITVDITDRYQYVRLRPLMTTYQAVGLTFDGDSVEVLTTGRYYIELGSSIDGVAGNDFHMKLFKNSTVIAVSDGCFFTTTGVTNFENIVWFWYIDLSAGDNISWYVANNTTNADCSIRGFKVYIEKIY